MNAPKLPRPLRPDDFIPPTVYDGRTPSERLGLKVSMVKGKVVRLSRLYAAGWQKEQDRIAAEAERQRERRRRGQ